MDSVHKFTRVLYIYTEMCEGRAINKKEASLRFGVDERSIQRDIDDIRAFLAEQRSENKTDIRQIVYDRKKDGFVMQGAIGNLMSNDEILAVSKILLESRAVTKSEVTDILHKLIAACVPQANMKLVSDLIANEAYHYVELTNKSGINDKLWALGEEIQQCNLLEITYRKQVSEKKTVKRVIQPVAIIFSEYYFYLNAFIVEKNENGTYEQLYDYPAVFRVDRILKHREMGEKFRIAYANRFEEGEFRKRVQFMFPGQLIRVEFLYSGRNVEAILDRLPTAKILSEDADGYIVQAEVYGNGILMWLLSQGSTVEVLRPQSLRKEMKRILQETLQKYES